MPLYYIIQVARDLTSEEVFHGIHDMKIFFTALRSRGQEVYDGWKRLVTSANAIWEEVLHDENLEKYFVAKNVTDFLQNYTTVAEVSLVLVGFIVKFVGRNSKYVTLLFKLIQCCSMTL